PAQRRPSRPWRPAPLSRATRPALAAWAKRPWPAGARSATARRPPPPSRRSTGSLREDVSCGSCPPADRSAAVGSIGRYGDRRGWGDIFWSGPDSLKWISSPYRHHLIIPLLPRPETE